MAKLVDSHCHLAMKEFAEDLPEVLARSSRAGVERILVVGSDEQGSLEAFRLVRDRNDGMLFAAVGIHPHDSAMASSGIPGTIEELSVCPEVVAVGETGLDYFYDHSPRDVQKRVFALHVGLARDTGKPLVVHVRDAYGDALEILRREKASECGGVIHCFSGSREDALAAIDLGFYISFAGPVTWPKNGSLREIAAALPMESILCETDAPFLSPQPKRGRRNEPANVAWVYEVLAQARGISAEKCAREIWKNSSRLFRWGVL